MNQDTINIFQNEFHRLLSPMEHEIISDFYNQGYTDEEIRSALKEAVTSGALSFRYISKILKSWKEKTETENSVDKDLSWLN